MLQTWSKTCIWNRTFLNVQMCVWFCSTTNKINVSIYFYRLGLNKFKKNSQAIGLNSFLTDIIELLLFLTLDMNF